MKPLNIHLLCDKNHLKWQIPSNLTVLFWPMSHPLTWRRRASWPILRPATRSRRFGFTFRGSRHFVHLYLPSMFSPHWLQTRLWLARVWRPLLSPPPQVLQSLQYVDSSGAVQLKGRVACQISSHEVAADRAAVWERPWARWRPRKSAALLSCLIFSQKTQVEPHIYDHAAGGEERSWCFLVSYISKK